MIIPNLTLIILLTFPLSMISIRIQLNRLDKPVNLGRDKLSYTQSTKAIIQQLIKNQPPQLNKFQIKQLNTTQLYQNKFQLQNFQNLQYYGSLRIGTSKTPISFIFDTGSNQLWFPTQNCTNCEATTKYDTSSSTLFSITQTTPQTIQYGKGQVFGYPCQDQVWFGQTLSDKVDEYPCLAVYKQIDFQGTVADGILGLAPLNTQGQPPYILDILVNNNVISERQISFRYTDKNSGDPSILILGRYDPSLIKPTDQNITLTLQSKGTLYAVELTGAKFAGQSIGSSNEVAILDTGTSLIIAPQTEFINLVNKIMSKFSSVYEYLGNLAVDCSQVGATDDLQITLESSVFKIPSSQLWRESAGYCFINIGSSTMNLWILGDVFIRDYYIVIDYDNSQVQIHGEKITETSDSTSYKWWIIGGVIILVVIVGCAVAWGCYCRRRKRAQNRFNLGKNKNYYYADGSRTDQAFISNSNNEYYLKDQIRQ